ncbi:MAG: NADP-dependent oxidoreductase [Candidatus Lutacidiplasmatales archaeon]
MSLRDSGGNRLAATPNRQWLLAGAPDGTVNDANFRWATSTVPVPTDGQMLLRNLWLSFDPTQYLLMRSVGDPDLPVGSVMRGLAVSQVVDSRLAGFRAGDIVHGFSGWEDYSLSDGKGFLDTAQVPPSVPPNLALGTLGVTGMAAYFGVVEVARPRAGETFVVSGAAGGVGSIAGQIAKIHGLRVIGITGGKAKVDWLLGEGRFDAAIDHRIEDVGARLTALCPDGIDIFFDNVGGPVLDEALGRLRTEGRVIVCGGTSRYVAKDLPPGPANYLNLCMVRGRMEGILARDYAARFPEAAKAMVAWIHSGQLRSKEDVAIGLENAPGALARLFRGENIGKQLLKIADPRTTPVG